MKTFFTPALCFRWQVHQTHYGVFTSRQSEGILAQKQTTNQSEDPAQLRCPNLPGTPLLHTPYTRELYNRLDCHLRCGN